ncbi:MAG: RnfABCDGE type electron transport complex subunit G [Eubacteriales bacterium]|nr:RnfABCDGE type electron transport complex subunit G [Eubacteriales bacterium]
MKKLSFKGIFIPAISLFLICLIATLLLAGTNELTKEPIAKQAQDKANAAMSSVCPEAVSFEQSKDGLFYSGFDKDGNCVGVAVPSSAKGYGGEVSIMVGFDTEGNILGVDILSQSETPGLGANCVKDDFKNQYAEKIPESGAFNVVKDAGKKGEGDIVAITSATITSKAVTEAVNGAIEIYSTVKWGEL